MTAVSEKGAIDHIDDAIANIDDVIAMIDDAELPAAVDVEAGDPGRADRVLEAVNATFRNAEFSCIRHYMDHVQTRWNINLARALSGSMDFIWSEQSTGERHHLMRCGWLRFFWSSMKLKLSWAARFRWIADRIDRRG